MQSKTTHITNVINELILNYIQEYDGAPLHDGGIMKCSSAYDINNGLCDDFAIDVLKKIGYFKNQELRFKVFELSTDMFMTDDIQFAKDEWNDIIIDKELAWSKRMFEIYGYPPELIYLPSHVWIFSEGKHYDSECPSGVKYWFELPIYMRLFSIIKKK